MKYFVYPCHHSQSGYTLEANSLEIAQSIADQSEYDYCCAYNLNWQSVRVLETGNIMTPEVPSFWTVFSIIFGCITFTMGLGWLYTIWSYGPMVVMLLVVLLIIGTNKDLN